MLNVYIEADAFTEPKFMEVSDEALISRLIPALVQELGLPQTDVKGKRLVYILRRATDGVVLPGNVSLRATETQPGTYLALEVASAATKRVTASRAPSPPRIKAQAAVLVHSGPVPQTPAHAPAFYAEQTMADASFYADFGSAPLPATPRVLASRGQRRWTRRALLMAGGAVLGATGIGLGYAAVHSSGNLLTAVFVPPHTSVAPQTNATAATQAVTPTRASSLLTFTQHKQIVRAVAWSPDGNMLASGANDALLLTWDLTGQVRLRKHQDASVRALAWSSDARQLAVASANQLLVLDAQTGTSQAPAAHMHRAAITTLAWSPRQPQLLVSAGLDKLAVVWNTQTFKPQVLFRQHSTSILSAGWASDGQTVATCSEGGVIRVWSGLNAQQLHGFFFDGGVGMTALAFDPVGTSLAVGGMDGVLRLWQSGLACQLEGQGGMQGQCLDKPTRLSGHTGPLRAVAWSSDGRFLASAGDDAQVLLWYPSQSATPILKVPQAAPVQSLAWSPNGTKLAVAAGKTVTLWTLA